jgi:hypothetical protein
MTAAPDALAAVAEPERRVRRRDYAAAACLTTRPDVLDAIAALAADADEARREVAASRLAEAERARVQAVIGPLLNELIGVLAEAMGMPKGAVCMTCKRALRRRTCAFCGTRAERAARAA